MSAYLRVAMPDAPAAPRVEGPVTLSKIFEAKELKDKITDEVRLRRKEADTRVERILWILVTPIVNARLEALMAMPLGDNLGRAYTTLEAVRTKAQESLEAKEIDLGPFDHEVTLFMEQALNVDAARFPVGRIDLAIEMTVKRKNAKVGILDGCLTHACPGIVNVWGRFALNIGNRVTSGDSNGNRAWTDLYSKEHPIVLEFPRVPFDPPIRIVPEAVLSALLDEPEGVAEASALTSLPEYRRRVLGRRVATEARRFTDRAKGAKPYKRDRRKNKRERRLEGPPRRARDEGRRLSERSA